LKKKDYFFFEQARLEAIKSDFNSFRLGSVIVYKNKIIGRGYNSYKTAPIQKYYNKYREFNDTSVPIKHSLHSEIAAIKSISYLNSKEIDFSKVRIYTYRICLGKKLGFGNAKSCPACYHAIKELGIKEVYYTTDNGYAMEKLF
jgi:deoxycytidylate deaminase